MRNESWFIQKQTHILKFLISAHFYIFYSFFTLNKHTKWRCVSVWRVHIFFSSFLLPFLSIYFSGTLLFLCLEIYYMHFLFFYAKIVMWHQNGLDLVWLNTRQINVLPVKGPEKKYLNFQKHGKAKVCAVDLLNLIYITKHLIHVSDLFCTSTLVPNFTLFPSKDFQQWRDKRGSSWKRWIYMYISYIFRVVYLFCLLRSRGF